jgi:hypothetical protein
MLCYRLYAIAIGVVDVQALSNEGLTIGSDLLSATSLNEACASEHGPFFNVAVAADGFVMVEGDFDSSGGVALAKSSVGKPCVMFRLYGG